MYSIKHRRRRRFVRRRGPVRFVQTTSDGTFKKGETKYEQVTIVQSGFYCESLELLPVGKSGDELWVLITVQRREEEVQPQSEINTNEEESDILPPSVCRQEEAPRLQNKTQKQKTLHI